VSIRAPGTGRGIGGDEVAIVSAPGKTERGDVVGTHAPSLRPVARVLVAFVVLAGLFLLHGLPAGN